MKKTLMYIIVAAVLIGLAAWKIADNKKKQETEVKEVAKQVDKINVNVITASRENIDTDYSANGTFIPKTRVPAIFRNFWSYRKCFGKRRF